MPPVVALPQVEIPQRQLQLRQLQHVLASQPLDRLAVLLPQAPVEEFKRPRHARRQEQLEVLELVLQQPVERLPRVGHVDLRERKPEELEERHSPVHEKQRSHLLLPEKSRVRCTPRPPQVTPQWRWYLPLGRWLGPEER